MEPEKRRFVRKRTDQLLYAELGPDNGSILLNLCEEGCSFQSIAPVRSEQLRFAVSVGDGCKLEGDGRMVWSDATKKTGGLHFLNPSQELQEQVREWLEQTLVTTDGGLVPGADSEAKRRRRKLRQEARVAAKLARKQGAVQSGKPETRAESEGQAVKAAIPETTTETTTETTQMISGARVAADLTSRQYRKPVGTWRGASIIALVALLFMAMVSYRRELGHLLMSFGSSMAGEEQKAGTAAPAEVQTVPRQLGIDAKPAGLSDRQDTSRGGVEEAEPVSNEQIAPSTSVPAVPAKHDATQQAGASEDVSSLWASVENGDTRAEVVLANRYLRGEGVPQSCAQARVLLEAAVKRGSAEAQQRLDELARGGCP